MTSAIVTGATGFVGVHLLAELLANNVEVWAICRTGSQNLGRLPETVHVIYVDIDSYDSLSELPDTGFDVFYHLAWEDASGPGRTNAAAQAKNVELALTALENAHRLGCGKFIALGTVYERFAPNARTRESFGGSDFYILSKDYTHAMLDKLAVKLGIPFVWATICHPIGRLIKPEQMMASVVSSLLSGTKLPFGPGTAVYDIVAVEDVARGLRLLGECALTKRVYYIGSGAPRRLKEYMEETRRILGTDTPIGFGERPDDGLRFEGAWFDIAPLAGETGYAPSVGFEQAVLNVADGVGER
ncbi:NAD-dependent epimerase [Clostridia bacterium]|nr:NAD-dependent epimerase [Clostridia bacterium]